MPKEQINYEPTQASAIEASIHWSPEPAGYAQLAFEFDVQVMIDYLTKLRKDSPDDARVAFYTPSLSRTALQTLIRAGKRARNSVYGADE